MIAHIVECTYMFQQYEHKWHGGQPFRWHQWGDKVNITEFAFDLILFSDSHLDVKCVSLSVRVSNELGSGHPRATKYSVINVVVQSLLIGLFFMAVILIAKNHFAVIFTSSPELQKAVAHLASLLGFTMVLNSVQPVISGTSISCSYHQ